MLAILLEVAVRRSEMKPSSINSGKKEIKIYSENQTHKGFIFGESEENLVSSSPKQQTKVSSLSSLTTVNSNKMSRKKVQDPEEVI